MESEKKVGCLVISTGDAFREMGNCAIRSFKKFHPDVDVHVVDENNIDTFEISKHIPEEIRRHPGTFRFGIAAEIMGKNKYDKFIMLGADTITCARLDEFMNMEEDILLTACYGYQLTTPYLCSKKEAETLFRVPASSFCSEGVQLWHHLDRDIAERMVFIHSPMIGIVVDPNTREVVLDPSGREQFITYFGHVTGWSEFKERFEKDTGNTLALWDYLHPNADVVCFNNLEALKDMFKLCVKHWKDYHDNPEFGRTLVDNQYDFYADQGALNMITTFSLINNQAFELPNFNFPCYNVTFVDLPFINAPHTYNVRSKKSMQELQEIRAAGEQNESQRHPKAHPDSGGEDYPSISDFQVRDGKLYTVDDKQIKVWHYLSNFGQNTKMSKLGRVNLIAEKDRIEPTEEEIKIGRQIFCDKVNSYIYGIFNQDTRDFFTDYCDCGDFFQKEFSIE